MARVTRTEAIAIARKKKAGKLKPRALFECLECGRKFHTVRSAELATWNGCPNCNSSDIDIALS